MNAANNYIKNIQPTLIEGLSESKFIISALNNYHKTVQSSPLSIKIVLSGREDYRINNHTFSVSAGQYLIVNSNENLTIDIQTKSITQGVCIYPPKEIIEGTYQNLIDPLANSLTHNDSTKTVHFTPKINKISGTLVGELLSKKLSNYLNLSKACTNENIFDFYSELSLLLIKDQFKINNELKRLKPLRKTTLEELYRRLNLAKEYIHDHQNEKIQLDDLTQLTCLSKFHFLRNFKDLYGQSPYQYLLQLKLQRAKTLLNAGYSYRSITEMIGFSDIKNLKKALKKS